MQERKFVGIQHMNIGVLTVNTLDFHPNKRLKAAADEQGHDLILINPYAMISTITGNRFDFEIKDWDKTIDVIMPRQGSPMGDYGLVLLRQFMQCGIPLVNGLKGVTIARNQYITLQTLAAANRPVPDTIFITKRETLAQAVDALGGYPVVIKPVNGMGGDGVIKVDHEPDDLHFLDEHLKENRGVLVQRFFHPLNRIDLRLLVIGDKVAGAMRLKPRNDEFRANINQNARAEVIEPSEEQCQRATASAKACHLEIAGIDLIAANNSNPSVIEVNYSPGFKGLEAAAGLDIAKQIIDYVTARYA